MATAGDIHSVDSLIGRTILSRATGNKLGRVHDLIVDPLEGLLLGIAAKTEKEELWVVEQGEIFSFGPDAVMVDADDSLSPGEGSGLYGAPLAKHTLIGAHVVTESGKLLGQVADLFILGAPPTMVVYEVRESILDKLLGRALFLRASAGRALSVDAKRIIVPDNSAGEASDTLEAFTSRLKEARIDERTVVRGGALGPFEEGTIEVTENAEEAVISKRPRVIEEVAINKRIKEHQETVRETLHGTEVDVEEVDLTRDSDPRNTS